MDPITLLLIATGAVAAAGVGVSLPPLWRHQKLRRARELVTRPIISSTSGDGSARSVYEVFSDLGASEYALEVMRHMDLLPEADEDIERVAVSLSDNIASFGGYDAMVSSLKETIRDLHEEAAGGERGRLTLMAPKGTDSLLPAVERPEQLPEGEEIKQLPERSEVRRAGAAPTGERPPGDRLEEESERLHATVDEALADLFGGKSPNPEAMADGAGGIAAIVIGGVLGSLTTAGGFWDGVGRFVQRRRVKQMRTLLNRELAGLSLDLFHAPADIQERVRRNLEAFLQESRWQVERHRREAKRHQKLPKSQRSTTQLAMKLLASKDARDDLSRAQRDIRQLQAQITRHRRGGRHDLAGFLIYVNRTPMLRGIDDFDKRVAAIEEAGEQLRRALLSEPGPTA